MKCIWASCGKNGWNLITKLQALSFDPRRMTALGKDEIMNTQTELTETLLDSGLSLRPAQRADVRAVAQLILAVCTADGDPIFATTEEELNRFWDSPAINLETDVWVVETKEGKIVGYQEFDNRY